MKRRLRRLLVVIAVLALFALAARCVLRSAYLAERVRSSLEAALGAPVGLAGIDVGFAGTTLQDLEVFEAASEALAGPWLRIERADVDVTVWSALRGRTQPHRVTLTGATVTLRLDAQGDLLTRFPVPKGDSSDGPPSLPELTLRDCRVIITRPGYPDLVIGVRSGLLHRSSGGIALNATASHPLWQTWEVSGGVDDAGKLLTLKATTQTPVSITPAMLEAIPFVPASTWKDVRLEGTSAGDIALRHDLTTGQFHYRIDLKSERTHVLVPAAFLDVDDTAGRVVIEDGLITLTGISGRAFGGKLATDATLDFRGEKARLHFEPLTGDGLDVLRLPKAWRWPRAVEGLLSGSARLDVTLGQASPTFQAQGKGQIASARLLGQPAAEPIRLKLDRDLDFDLRMDDADLPALLRGMGFTVPAGAAGRFDLQVFASQPIERLGDLKSIHGGGRFATSQATLGPLRLEQVQTELTLAVGRLEARSFGASLRPASKGGTTEGAPGRVSGSAVLDLDPPGELCAALTVERLPVRALAGLLAGTYLPDVAVSGAIKARAPTARLRDASAWQADGTLTATDWHWSGLTVHEGRAEFSLRKGVLNMTKVEAKVAGGDATGAASVRTQEPFAIQGQVNLAAADVSQLARLRPELTALSPRGRLDLAAGFAGNLSHGLLKAAGSARFTAGNVGKIPFDMIAFDWSADGARVRAGTIKARGPFGEIEGECDLAIDPEESSTAKMLVRHLDLGLLAATLQPGSLPVAGKVNGTLALNRGATPAGLHQRTTLDLQMRSGLLSVFGLPVDGIEGRVTLDPGILAYDLKAETLDGRLAATGRFPLVSDKTMTADRSGKVTFDGLQLMRLARLLVNDSASSGLRGTADGYCVYHHDPEGRPVGAGRVEIIDLGLVTGQRLGDVRAELRLNANELRLLDISGDISQGVLQGSVSLPLNKSRPGHFLVIVQGADAADVLAPWFDRKTVQGPLTLRLDGQLGHGGSGGGILMLNHGKVCQVDVTELYLPFRWHWHPGQRRLQADFADSHALVATGRATGSAELLWDAGLGLHIAGQVKFLGLQLRGLFPDLAGAGWGNAQTSGRCEFTGDDVHSPGDLKITLDGQIRQMPARSAPLLGPIIQALPLPGSWSVQNGEYRLLMDKGLVRVQKLALTAGRAHLFLQGTVSPAGNLQLDVTADPGHLLPDIQIAKLLGIRPGDNGPLSLQVLSQASSYLAKRLIAAHVTGTARAPVVQIRPAPALTEDALRFFMKIGGP